MSAVAAVVIPALGLLLQASRRNRLLRRIDDYLRLAEQFEQHDKDAANEFRRLGREVAMVLARRDERGLHRRIDPAAVLALIFLTVPAAAGLVLTFGWDSGWAWPVRVFAAVWIALWGGVGLTQLWEERGDETEADRDHRS